MQLVENDKIVAHTKKWITDVVIGCNFCPFAAKEVKRSSICYEVLNECDTQIVLETVVKMCNQLDKDKYVATSFLILPNNYNIFTVYLSLVEQAEMILKTEGYEGVYQLASFHPQYLFAGSNDADASNYTNRSPYPMLHFLREDSVSIAIDNHPNIDEVPNQNIAYTQKMGLIYMKDLLAACL